MRTILIVLLVMFSLTAMAQEKSVKCEPKLFAFNYQTKMITSDVVRKKTTEDFRSGCCSHHGGVCGCSGGRALCCDGTLSPSCGCD